MAFDYIPQIGLLLLFGTIIVLVHNAGTVLACLFTGVRLKKVEVFCGKPVFTLPTPFAPVAVGYIPLGGSVEFDDMDSFLHKPRWSRCLVFASGPMAVFLSALVCLGFLHTAASFLSTYPQFIGWILSPLSYDKGFGLFATFLAYAQAAPVAGFGILAAKSAALNLLPLPTLPGGRLLIEFIEMVLSRFFPGHAIKTPAKLLNYFQSLIAIILIVCLIAGVIAFFRQL